jgi:tyrosyl-tRNA synthetase
MAAQSAEQRLSTIVKGLEEVVAGENHQELLELLKTKEHPVIYWGTATTGKPHMGYFVPIYKISDFLAAGCEVKILFADLHGFLDNQKSNWQLLAHRCKYYEFIIKEMLTVIGVPLDKLSFVKGTDYQLSREYTLDMYQMAAITTTEHTAKAGAEVVKQVKNPLMSSLIYPILQALDEQYLGVDMQFGGVDQRKIFMFAREWLPKIGYKKRLHLMNSLIPGLTKSGKMSSSEPLSKIDFDESDESICSKFKQAYSVDGQVDGNGMLALLKHILLRRCDSQGRHFLVKRSAEHGGDITFKTYEEVEAAFRDGKIVSGDLKPAVADEVCKLIAPLRAAINKHMDLLANAYPPEEKAAPATESATGPATIGSLDIRVGKIVKVDRLEKSDSLYVSQIDVGEATPRTILSGLVKWVPIEQLQDRLVLVLCNLPSKAMRGVTSQGMVLATSLKEGKNTTACALIDVPAGSVVGEKLNFDVPETPDKELTPKRLDRVLENTVTSSDGSLVYKKTTPPLPFKTSAGVCTSSLKDALVG